MLAYGHCKSALHTWRTHFAASPGCPASVEVHDAIDPLAREVAHDFSVPAWASAHASELQLEFSIYHFKRTANCRIRGSNAELMTMKFPESKSPVGFMR